MKPHHLLAAALLAFAAPALAQDGEPSRCAPGSGGSTSCRPGGQAPVPLEGKAPGREVDNGSDPNSAGSVVQGVTGSPAGADRGTNPNPRNQPQ